MIGNNVSIKPTDDGFEVNAEFKGESARDLNRVLLSEFRGLKRKLVQLKSNMSQI